MATSNYTAFYTTLTDVTDGALSDMAFAASAGRARNQRGRAISATLDAAYAA